MPDTSTQPSRFEKGRIILQDGRSWNGFSFGHEGSSAGEVVFSTGMVGYPEALTDPSFFGQILVLTYPLIGNYGVPEDKDDGGLSAYFESRRIQVAGLIISDYSRQYSHWQAFRSLDHWLKEYNVPALMGVDTRAMTKHLREQGAMLGKIELPEHPVEFWDPNSHSIIEQVTITEPENYGNGSGPRVLVLDCGCKESILGNLVRRGVSVTRVPAGYDLSQVDFDGLVVSSGPGDPKICQKQIETIREAMRRDKPLLGICLGHQMLALAVGAQTYKLKYGHRSQNQPVIDEETNHCYITSQNHGFAVDTRTLPEDWKAWFTNLNDDTNEGIRHKSKPWMSVQFHPEAAPGPVDTEYIFDDFVKIVKS